MSKQRSSLHQLPIQETLLKYKEFLNDNNDYIKIDSSSIKLIDEKEIFSLDSFELFRVNIFNGAHYEYNNGQIICLALVSKFDSTDIRILFPKSYTSNSSNFFDPYLDKFVSNKNEYCSKLSNLINYNITYQTKNIQYKYLDSSNTLSVISNYELEYHDLLNNTNHTSIEADTIKFYFISDTLKSFSKIGGK